jgi:carbon storage regulator
MLVISRKAGETLVIDDQIKVTVISIVGDKVTLGIDAPKDINVAREELLETIKANISSSEKSSQADYLGIATLIKNKKSRNDGIKDSYFHMSPKGLKGDND